DKPKQPSLLGETAVLVFILFCFGKNTFCFFDGFWKDLHGVAHHIAVTGSDKHWFKRQEAMNDIDALCQIPIQAGWFREGVTVYTANCCPSKRLHHITHQQIAVEGVEQRNMARRVARREQHL